MPGRTPKDPWGYYAPAYDPDTDPWETDSDKEARYQQQQQQQPVMPPGANRWGYTLAYHPPVTQQARDSQPRAAAHAAATGTDGNAGGQCHGGLGSQLPGPTVEMQQQSQPHLQQRVR